MYVNKTPLSNLNGIFLDKIFHKQAVLRKHKIVK